MEEPQKVSPGNTPQDAGDGVVKFDEKQQAALEKIITDRLERQKRTDERKQKEALAALEAKIRAELAPPAPPDTSEREQLEAKSAKLEENATALRAQNSVLRREKALNDAIGAVPFINRDEARQLIEAFATIEPDEGGNFVAREHGEIVLDADGKPVPLSELVLEWGIMRPHLLKGQTKGGSGSSEVHRTARPLVHSHSDAKTLAEKVNYIKRHGYKQWASLPSK